MPSLSNLICEVEWDTPAHLALQEYNTAYSDGYVECFLAIPPNPTNFAIHLSSNGYIASGLGMYVFIDGVYQCNRHRSGLRMPAEGVKPQDCEIDFRVRQKEYQLDDGDWEGAPWKFATVAEETQSDYNGKGNETAAEVGEYGGMIDVLVLRCYPSDPSKSPRSRSSSPVSSVVSGTSSGHSSYMDDQEVSFMTGAMFDGSGDTPPRVYPGQSREKKSTLVNLRGGGAGSPPPSTNLRQSRHSRHPYDTAEEDGHPQVRVGAGLFYSSKDAKPSRQRHKDVRGHSPFNPRIRGGGGSDSNRSKEAVPSPIMSLKSYRLGSGDLQSKRKSFKGFKGSYTPDQNSYSGGDDASKIRKGSTGSYTPDPNDDWGAGGNWEINEDGQADNVSKWEPPASSGGSIRQSNPRQKGKEKQRNLSNTSSQKHSTKLNGSRFADNRKEENSWVTDENQNCDSWGNNDASNNQRADDQGDTDNENSKTRQDNGWYVDGIDHSGQQNTSWDDNNNDNNDARAEDQTFTWGSTNGKYESGKNQDDDWAKWNAGGQESNTQPGSWDNEEANNTTTTQENQNKKKFSNSLSKASSPNNKPSSRDLNRGIKNKRPPNLTPTSHFDGRAIRPSPRGSQGKFSRRPSPSPHRSASKSASGVWAPGNSSSKKVFDEVEDKVAGLPGSWSPPLEQKEEKKERIEVVKRRAAEYNAERAKAAAAALKAESPKSKSFIQSNTRRSKHGTPLSTATYKPLAIPGSPAPRHAKGSSSQFHRKRPATIIKENFEAADTANDQGPTHRIRNESPLGYVHKIKHPHYLDDLDDPYAMFRFHYRDMAVISRMCGRTITETKDELKNRLASLTKDDLLELFAQARSAVDDGVDENLTWRTDPGKAGYTPNLDAATEKLDEWGGNQDSSGDSEQADNDESGKIWDQGNESWNTENMKNEGNADVWSSTDKKDEASGAAWPTDDHPVGDSWDSDHPDQNKSNGNADAWDSNNGGEWGEW